MISLNERLGRGPLVNSPKRRRRTERRESAVRVHSALINSSLIGYADFIRKGKLRREGLCPFFLFAGLLARTLDYGSEAQLTSQDNERFAISALERALKQIAGALNKLDRKEIEIHHRDDPFYAKLMDIAVSERFLTSALEALKARYNAPLDKRGRPEMLERRVRQSHR
jgi:hypothetical protein